MATNILMPALSPTMTEGTLARWLKKEGDEVKAGDVIAEIETDKATMEVEAVDEGVLGRILVGDGTEGVKVNDPIAVLVEPGEAVPEGGAGAPATPALRAQGRRRRSRPGQRARAIRLRRRGDRRRRGERRQGRRRGGAAGRPADLADGAPARRAARRSRTATRARRRTRLRLAARAAHGAAGGARPVARAGQRPERPHREERYRSGAGARPGGAAGAGGPAAATRAPRRAARRAGAEAGRGAARRPAQGGAEQHDPQGHRAAPVGIEADHPAFLRDDGLRDRRAAQAARRPQREVAEGERAPSSSRSTTSSSRPWRRRCAASRTSTPCGPTRRILQFDDVDVSVAVATPTGLITPIIRKADKKGLSAISNEMKDLAARAKASKLKPEEFQGGGFSISNMGMYGVQRLLRHHQPAPGRHPGGGGGRAAPGGEGRRARHRHGDDLHPLGGPPRASTARWRPSSCRR